MAIQGTHIPIYTITHCLCIFLIFQFLFLLLHKTKLKTNKQKFHIKQINKQIKVLREISSLWVLLSDAGSYVLFNFIVAIILLFLTTRLTIIANIISLSLSLSLSLIFHFSIIISTPSHFITLISTFLIHTLSPINPFFFSFFFLFFTFFSLLMERKCNISCICVFFFWWHWYI